MIRATPHIQFARTLLPALCALSACSDPAFDSAAPTEPRQPARTVTLLTGDRVSVAPAEHGGVVAHAGPGRAGIGFLIGRVGNDTIVIPRDAAPLLASDQLDSDLFNVSYLVANGYDDAARNDIPLLITGPAYRKDAAVASDIRSRIASADTDITRVMPSVGAVAVRQRKATATSSVLAEVARSPGHKVWLDRKLALSLDHSVSQIGAPVAWASGYTGAGVVVAVLDSGIDDSHPDLAGVVVDAANFLPDTTGTADLNGHGTHVASTIAGSGAASGGQFRGVAPGAQLLNARVCDVECSTSAVLAGIEWAVVTKGAPIVNLSLGGPDSAGDDPLEAAINQLSAEHGTLFVIAAGNFGRGNVDSPSTADAALSVGAIDRDDELAPFSGTGPRKGDSGIKPEITAPGVEITAALAAGVEPRGTPVGTAYMRLSGTSMATPHVAGAAAIIRQQHPRWTGAQVKAALVGAANPHPARTVFEQGAGRLDVARAFRQSVTAQPITLSLGVALYPHDDDPLLTRTVTYHNAGAEPITLALAASLAAVGGAATEMVTLSTSTLTVPAGGDAEVEVTVDTRGDLPNTIFTGAVVATAGELRIVVPLAVEREIDLPGVTLQVLDPSGAPSPFGLGFISSVEPPGPDSIDRFIFTGRTLRLPPKLYAIGILSGFEPGMVMVYPRLQLTRTTTVLLDGRQTAPISVDVANVALDVVETEVTMRDAVRDSTFTTTGPGLWTGHFGPAGPPGELLTTIIVGAVPAGASDGAAFYTFARRDEDRLSAGWTQSIAPSQLATVRAIHSGDDGTRYRKLTLAVPDGVNGFPEFFATPFADAEYLGPFERTEHYFGDRMQWTSVLNADRDDLDVASIMSPPQRYRAGQLRERWNRAPFGPAFPSLLGSFHATRTGDVLDVSPTLFSDVGSPSRSGRAASASRMTLFRNDVRIAERIDSGRSPLPAVRVPPERAVYRLEAEAVRDPAVGSNHSSEVRATWTFASRHAPGPAPQVLPLPVLRFAPELDLHNQAPRHFPLALPVTVERPPGAVRPAITQLTIEASFDDGATWRPVVGLRSDDRWRGLVIHPPGAAFVSLRGSARDVEGNRVEQTIMRAYQLR